MNKLTIKTDLKIKQSSSSYGYVTHFEGTKVFNSIEEAEELNYYDIKGALLSYNYETGKYTVWNGEEDLDSRAWDYREDKSDYATETSHIQNSTFTKGWSEPVVFPENDYGDVIAICVGNGIWIYIMWNPNNDGDLYQWCTQNNSDPLYKKCNCFSLSGVENTRNLLTKVSEDFYSVFLILKLNTGLGDGTQGHLYVPSKYEIIFAVTNQATIDHDEDQDSSNYIYLNNLCHACNLTEPESILTSNQSGQVESVYSLVNGDALMSSYKLNGQQCFVCIHFGNQII